MLGVECSGAWCRPTCTPVLLLLCPELYLDTRKGHDRGTPQSTIMYCPVLRFIMGNRWQQFCFPTTETVGEGEYPQDDKQLKI